MAEVAVQPVAMQAETVAKPEKQALGSGGGSGLVGVRARLEAAFTTGSVKEKATAAAGLVKAQLEALQCTLQQAKAVTSHGIAAACSSVASARDTWPQGGAKAYIASLAQDAMLAARSTATSLMGGAAMTFAQVKVNIIEGTCSAWNTGVCTICTSLDRLSWAVDTARDKAYMLSGRAREVAADSKFQATAASTAGGAIALGASGGTAGLAVGSAIGAAVGLVPALFTLGLSIPIGAAIGGGSGLVLGTVAGGTCGAVGAGAAGYGVYSKKEQISRHAEYAWDAAAETTSRVKERSAAAMGHAVERAGETADYARAKANASASFVSGKVSAARARLVGRSGAGDA